MRRMRMDEEEYKKYAMNYLIDICRKLTVIKIKELFKKGG
jgi:hypothetical protein